jgi:hypothetical protein
MVLMESVQYSKADLSVDKKRDIFPDLLFASYRKLIQGQAGIKSVVFAELRQEVALSAYTGHSIIITRNQFDILIKELRFITDSYRFMFGRPMGAEEELLQIGNESYETIAIEVES